MTTESTEYEIFREKVRLVMASQGVTYPDLTERTGIVGPNISALLNGRQEPRLSTMSKIASGLGVKLTDLLDPKFEPEAAKAAV